jgi:hypothetical protein
MGTLDFTLGHENQRAGEVGTNVVAAPRNHYCYNSLTISI